MDEALAVDGAAPPTPDAPAASSAPAYPRHWEADVVASDGGVVHLRPILPSDADAIVEFHSRLSERTRYLRYFGAYPQIPPRDLERFTVVDHHARVALVVLLGDEVIAVGCYEGTFGPDGNERGRPGGGRVRRPRRSPEPRAGLDPARAPRRGRPGAWRAPLRGRGPGRRTPRWCGCSGTRASSSAASSPRACCIWSSTSTPPSGRWRSADAREQCAEARSVHNVLHPRSVAVIGASTDPTEDRPRGAAAPAARQLRRAGVPGQPRGPLRPRCPRVCGGHRDPRRRGPRRGRRAGGRDERGHGLLPGQGRQGTGRAQRRLRRRRPGRDERPAPARRGGPRARDAGGGPERARGREHRSAGPAQRHAGPGPAPGRPGGLLQPVRRAERHPARRRPPGAGWACRPSSRPATARTCRATTCCSTGRPIPPRTSCCCTWSRSATRASSPAWPAGSRARSRSWR